MKLIATPLQRKMVIVGDFSVGKSSLLLSMLKGEFDDVRFHPMLYETRNLDLVVNGRPLELSLRNTAPQEGFDRHRPLGYPGAAVIALAFAIDDPKSFRSITERWYPEIMHFCSIPRVPTILIGCKSDMRGRRGVEEDGSSKTNEITMEQGHMLAKQIGAMAYLECSSKSGDGVEDVVKLVAKTVMAWDPRAVHKSNRACLIL